MTRSSGYALIPSATCDMIFGVDADQVVAAHPGLRGPAVTITMSEPAMSASCWSLQGDVKPLYGRLPRCRGICLGQPLDDVEQHDVAEFALGAQLGSTPPI